MVFKSIVLGNKRYKAVFGFFFGVLLLAAPGLAMAEQFTVFNFNQMYEQQQYDNSTILDDTAFFLISAGHVNDETVDMKPIRYVVWNKLVSMNKAAEGIALLDAFNNLMLQSTFYYNTEQAQLSYASPTELKASYDMMNGVMVFTVSAYNSNDIVNEPQYNPYAEYSVDMATVRRHFQEGQCYSPIYWDLTTCDMPYHIASTRESNTLRRTASMVGQEMLVARAADAAMGYYTQRHETIMRYDQANGYANDDMANDSMAIYTTGHAFADVDGDGTLDFMTAMSVDWPSSQAECSQYPTLLILSSRAGAVIIEDIGCTGTFPIGLADMNGDQVLDIVSYSTFWEWTEIEVVTLAGGVPKLLGVEVW